MHKKISCRMLARTAVQRRVLVALIQCATMAIEVVEVATESEEDVIINCVAIFYEEGKEGENFRRAETIRKYRQRIGILQEGTKTLKVGKCIYTKKKRNIYKINPQTGVYGNVNIDVPKLYGQLKLIAHKDGKKFYEKQVDCDTLDP